MPEHFSPTEWITTKEAAELAGWGFFFSTCQRRWYDGPHNKAIELTKLLHKPVASLRACADHFVACPRVGRPERKGLDIMVAKLKEVDYEMAGLYRG